MVQTENGWAICNKRIKKIDLKSERNFAQYLKNLLNTHGVPENIHIEHEPGVKLDSHVTIKKVETVPDFLIIISYLEGHQIKVLCIYLEISESEKAYKNKRGQRTVMETALKEIDAIYFQLFRADITFCVDHIFTFEEFLRWLRTLPSKQRALGQYDRNVLCDRSIQHLAPHQRDRAEIWPEAS